MHEAKQKHEPVQQSVHVDCPIEDAFRLFTEAFGEWWPFSQDCRMEPWLGGRLFERTASGQELEWGSVTSWDPPRGLEFNWHPGGPRDDEQTVEVQFRVEADGTRVTVTHRGWDRAGTQVCMSQNAAALRFAEFVCELLVIA